MEATMTAVETCYGHIQIDDKGRPVIADTTMKVVELVQEQLATGCSAEELKFQFPHLTLGQIHSALGYYWDHKEELDRYIADVKAMVEELRRTTPEPPIVARIREIKRLQAIG